MYRLLQKYEKLQWTQEAQDALDDLKRFMLNPPILVASLDNEPLLLYIAATTQVVSVALVVKMREEGHI